MALAEYHRKRRFGKTPEPRGRSQERPRGKPLRFVVQKHDASHLHYDFRLELDGVLKSWAVPKGPSLNPKDKRLAMQTEDHPLSYIDFEGAIPEGNYGAGDVIVWDTGLYGSSETSDPEAGRKKLKSGFHRGEIKFVLLGQKLKGAFALVKLKRGDDNSWLLIKEKDDFASDANIAEQTQSVLSGQQLPRDEKKRAPAQRRRKKDPMPHKIRPMLATLVQEPFDEKNWFFEIKWDGYRAIAEIEGKRVRLYSRRGLSFAETYPPIFDALKEIKHECVLDGEIVALKEGRPDFHALQEYGKKKAPLQYVLFDLLCFRGQDLCDLPLRERKALLRELLPEHAQLVLSEHVEERGMDFFRMIKKEGIEGMVGKDASSPYRQGVRSGQWRKVKNIREQEAIIVGYTKPRGARKNLGALVLAVYDNGTLTYIGHSGGGFTEAELRDICRTLEKIKVSRSPLKEKVPVNSPITWVKPKYVCSVQFTEWTPEGHMRHPIYRGLRTDKTPKEVVKEIPEQSSPRRSGEKKSAEPEVQFTHLDKLFWPKEKYTKGDVIEYYERMADTILPYLLDRPENLNRHPNGIARKGFYQKNIEGQLPSFVETKQIWSESNRAHLRYLLCQNKATLLYLANLGCIEINPWNSRVRNLDKPDYMIIDLDPGNNSFDELVEVAQEVHRVLELACEAHYVKTSGKTGLHICVPLGGAYSYDEVRPLCELLAKIVHERLPEITSIERSPAKRRNKIYLDYLQNRRGQTIAAPYSLRPYPGATVSTPLEWREVRKGLDPAKFTIRTMQKRLEKKGDLWRPVLGRGIDLRESIRCLEDELGAKSKKGTRR